MSGFAFVFVVVVVVVVVSFNIFYKRYDDSRINWTFTLNLALSHVAKSGIERCGSCSYVALMESHCWHVFLKTIDLSPYCNLHG